MVTVQFFGGASILLQFCPGHAGVHANELVDNLITQEWRAHLRRAIPQPLCPLPLSHTATARLLLGSLRSDELEVLRALITECDSRSGPALCALGADASQIRDWLFRLRDSRPPQAIPLRHISDSGLRINDVRMRCPYCEVALSLTHVLCECPALGRPRQ